jgi:integrase
VGHSRMKLPRYIQQYIDRHGKARWYFRRAGFPRIPLPGLPWSPEFMAAYELALAGQPIEIGSKKIKPGTMRALAVSYFNSLEFHSLRASSQSKYRGIIESFCSDKGTTGIPYGDMPAASLRREHVVKLMAQRASKPSAANNLRQILRALMAHAVESGMRKDDPAREVKPLKIRTDGHHSWTEDEISQFEARHPIGSRARLAFALLLYTGQRRSDVVKMGRQHVRDGCIHVCQQKTGADLDIPIWPELQTIIDATPNNHMTYLVTELGKPFTAAGFGNWFRDRCNEAGLPQCSAHGLRKSASRRLAEHGCTVHEVAAITGHASLQEVQRYTKGVDQPTACYFGAVKNENIQCLTQRKVRQSARKIFINQSLKSRVADAVDLEPVSPCNFWETQGDFAKMQGGDALKPPKSFLIFRSLERALATRGAARLSFLSSEMSRLLWTRQSLQ